MLVVTEILLAVGPVIGQAYCHPSKGYLLDAVEAEAVK